MVVCYGFVVFFFVCIVIGEFFIVGCCFMGFIDEEECLGGFVDCVLFLLESELCVWGVEVDIVVLWSDYMVVDGLFIIG